MDGGECSPSSLVLQQDTNQLSLYRGLTRALRDCFRVMASVRFGLILCKNGGEASV